MKRILMWLSFMIIPVFGVFAQQTIETKIDSNVVKTNGDTIIVFKYTEIDTIYTVNGNGDTIGCSIDTTYYDAVNICLGDSIIVKCYGLYDGSIDRNSDLTSLSNWDFGDGRNTQFDLLTQTITYSEVGCYDINVVLVDQYGNIGTTSSLRVRIADYPIKRVFDLGAICSTDSLLLGVGYDANDFILLNKINFEESVTKEYSTKTFIPDGKNCPNLCFTADVNFDEFPQGKTILSADDICSICINMEHSYMGDYRLSIICPSGQSAVLKYGTKGSGSNCDPSCPNNAPDGSFGGGSQYLGIPYGGSNDGAYDNTNTPCDSAYNMFGDGLTYCFSRNGEYTFASGNPANTSTLTTDDYIASTNPNYQIQYTNYAFQTIPAPYNNAGTTAPPSTFRTKLPSDHDNKSNYYAPAEDFTSLIGCPLNGTWQIEVCDFWTSDNGWVFSWNMDICGISNGSCEYQVGIDTVIWTADENLNFNYKDSVNAYISAKDTSGTFPLTLNVYDDFGCVWKDIVNINIVQTPEPELGDNVAICSSDSIMLSAYDSHVQYHETYSYAWEPVNDISPVIYAKGDQDKDYTYIVQVTNTQFNLRCSNRDSVKIHINKKPIINIDPGVYPLEGCEPFKINFKNLSRNVETFRWDFGDKTYSNELSTIHTYREGVYNLRCFAVSEDGCSDSLTFDSVITVFSSPKAMFTWEPVFPTVTNPYIRLSNQSTGTNPKYYWEFQYDKDNPYSFHTLTSENPFFAWVSDGEDISGTYIVRLIAKTINMGPSGHVLTCVDTTESRILMVNDFLQFPNVVTPNGDGINDIFIIKNLLSGSYPINALHIYNKWGSLVYQVYNISKESDFWDPNKTNSPDGTYFFRFSGKGYTGNVERRGVVEVLR